MRFPLGGKRLPIALDFGDDGVKLLQMRQVGGTLAVTACGRWRAPQSLAPDPKGRRESMVAAVRDMLRRGGFRGRRAVSALPCSQMGIKNVRLPQMPEHELRQAVAWEASERLGFRQGVDQLSYIKAGQVRTAAENRDEIIILTAGEQIVRDRLELLDEMGLRAEHVEAEPVALFRGFERFLRRCADEQVVSVVIDVGVTSTRVVVARGRQIVFIKSIDIGGRNFNEVVAGHLNLSYAEAAELRTQKLREHSGALPGEEPRREDDSDVNWTLYDAVRGEVERLTREISLCLRYCAVTFRGLHPAGVIVTGGEAYDPVLMELLGEQLGIECQAGRPMSGFDLSAVDFGGNRRGSLAEWALCVGLAVRCADLQVLSDRIDNGEHRLSA